MPEIKVRKADGTLATMIVDEEFVESLHNNWKAQMNMNGYDADGTKKKDGHFTQKVTMMEESMFKTKNGDVVFIDKTEDGKIRITINDGDGEGTFTVKETKELIEMLRKTIIS